MAASEFPFVNFKGLSFFLRPYRFFVENGLAHCVLLKTYRFLGWDCEGQYESQYEEHQEQWKSALPHCVHVGRVNDSMARNIVSAWRGA